MPAMDRQTPPTLRRALPLLIAIAAYAALAVALTWPLAANLTTHVPGDGSDDPALAWNLWWVKYALLDLHTSPLYTDFMFYPIGVNLAYFTITLLNGLAAIPLQAIFGLIAANNLVVLGYFVLSAVGACLLARDVLEGAEVPAGIRQAAAFLAGVVFAFAPGRFLFAGFGQFNVLSTAWIPLYVWALLRLVRRPGLKWGAWAGVFLLFNALAEYTYASFVLIFTAFYLVYLWLADRAVLFSRSAQSPGLAGWLRRWNWRLIGGLSLAGAIFAVGFSPFLFEMFREIAVEGDYMMAGWGFADAFSTDLLGFFVPSVLHPLLGDWARQFTFTYTNFATVGAATLVLALLAAFLSRRVRFWAWSALAFALLMLGPVLHINGRYIFDLDGLLVRIPLPFILLHYVPLIKGNRYPSRFTVMLALCLAVLAAWGAARLLAWLRGGGAGRGRPLLAAVSFVAILCLVLFDSVAVPIRLSDLRAPAIYQTLREEPGDFTVLELPLGWRNGFRVTGAQHTAIMYQQFYQATSQKRMLGGNTSRNPEFKFDYFVRAPLIRSLIALEEKRPLPIASPPSDVVYDKAIAAEVLRFFGVRYVIIHPPYTGGPLEGYLTGVAPLNLVYDQENVRAYRVDLPPAPEVVSVTLASDLSHLYLGEGWGEPEGAYRWVQRQEARLFLPLEAGRGYRLTLRAMAPGPGQTVSLRMNGAALTSVPVAEGWHELSVELPAGRVRGGLNEVTLGYSRVFPLLGGQAIGKTGVASPVNIVARSAGQEAGDYAHVYVNGRDVTPNRRGYNVAVINPSTGVVEQAAAYDTFEAAVGSNRMAEMLNKVPAGRIVAVAVRDEASTQLKQDAVDALGSIGATVDVRTRFRWGHVVIGVKGAPEGSALEDAGRDGPLQVYVGRNVTTAEVGIAVESVSAAPLR